MGQSRLYFIGQTFLFAASSSMVHGVGRDAEYVVRVIQVRQHLKQSEGADLRQQYQLWNPMNSDS